MGMLNSDIRKEFLRSLVVRLGDEATATLSAAYDTLASHAHEFLAREGFTGDGATLIYQADMRFAGQQSDIPITLSGPSEPVVALRESFEREYERLFGHVPRQGTIEIRGARVIGCGQLQRIRPLESELLDHAPEPIGTRRVFAEPERGFVDMPIYDGPALLPGARVAGPAIIEEATTTIALTGDDIATLNRFGEYIIEIAGVQ
jgi:N-methylhydantoinase A